MSDMAWLFIVEAAGFFPFEAMLYSGGGICALRLCSSCLSFFPWMSCRY